MIYFLILAVLIAFVYFFLSRGRKAVRAFFYTRARDRGEGVNEENRTAQLINFRRASENNLAMIDYASAHFHGSQLRLIDAARRDGFSE